MICLRSANYHGGIFAAATGPSAAVVGGLSQPVLLLTSVVRRSCLCQIRVRLLCLERPTCSEESRLTQTLPPQRDPSCLPRAVALSSRRPVQRVEVAARISWGHKRNQHVHGKIMPKPNTPTKWVVNCNLRRPGESFWKPLRSTLELRTCIHHPCPGGPTCLGKYRGR